MSDELKRFAFFTSEADRDVLRRAIELYNAMTGLDDTSDSLSDGAAIVAIVKAWREAETARIRAAKGGTS